MKRKEGAVVVDCIYYNGDIHAFDKENHIYQAVAIKNDKIVFAGTDEMILAQQTSRTNVINLHRQTMLPGFIDAHLHIFPLGFNLSYVNCQLNSIEEVVEAIKEQASKTTDENEWIMGVGFDESLFKEGRKLNKWDFEEINNPVYIVRYCLHEAVVNHTAIEKANITNELSIKNGVIERNKDGEATGLLKENAMSLVKDVLPPYNIENMTNAIQLANQHLLENGITSVHDAGLGFFVDPYKEFEVLQLAAKDKKLQVKMYLMVLAEYFEQFYDKNKDAETNQLKFGSMKLFSDGTLSGETAALLEPYKDSTQNGMLLYSDEEMSEYVKVAHKMNKQVAVHAIGSRAIEQVLRVYEANLKKHPLENPRHRIEHATITNDDLIQKMRELNVVPVSQPSLIYAAGDTHNAVIERENNKYFAYKSFINKELQLAGSSDSPVVDVSPFLGIYAAMKRRSIKGNIYNEDECLTLNEAIKMYTLNAAYAAFEEDVKGSIEVGKYADFVVLPEGFMSYTAEEVKKTKINQTIVNGEIVFSR